MNEEGGPVAYSTTPTRPSAAAGASREKRTTRRSARVLEHDPIVAPGFGTQKDIQRLSAQLSSSVSHFPPEAVLEMMSARGRGLRSSRGADDDEKPSDASSSLWADFMKEEGVGISTAAASAPTTANDASAKSVSEERGMGKATGGDSKASSKRTKTSPTAGTLVQTGTLDATVVGRGTIKSNGGPHLFVPTVILPSVKISRVFTNCNAVHSVALDANGVPYGWGRNEAGQLGSHLPSNVVLPTRLLEGGDGPLAAAPVALRAAALGKSHTLLLAVDGNVWAVGSNKVGQCGIQKAGDHVPNFRQCTLPVGTTISQIACGEDFSAALDGDGVLHTTGSSEFGQLANGETGEYFVTANKLAFANCQVFTARRVFVHAPSEKLHTKNEHCKTVPLEDSAAITLSSIACGKHHGLAVEDVSLSARRPRAFTWGCGNYGCLGHGVQADEYYPRLIGIVATLPLSTESGGRVEVSAGAHCSLLRTPSGHVYYWGKHRSVGEAVMRPKLVEELANNGHVVTHCSAGGQTVVCCTATCVVAWGQGPHGELGLADKKSSAKPTFVTALDGKSVLDVSCGYGQTLFVVEDAKGLRHVDSKELVKVTPKNIK